MLPLSFTNNHFLRNVKIVLIHTPSTQKRDAYSHILEVGFSFQGKNSLTKVFPFLDFYFYSLSRIQVNYKNNISENYNFPSNWNVSYFPSDQITTSLCIQLKAKHRVWEIYCLLPSMFSPLQKSYNLHKPDYKS